MQGVPPEKAVKGASDHGKEKEIKRTAPAAPAGISALQIPSL